MKKVLVIVVLEITIMLSLTSCVKWIDDYLYTIDPLVGMEEIFDELLEKLEKQDKKGITEMFSKTALKEAENYEENLDYLFEFFQGEVIAWEKGGSSEEYGRNTGSIEYYDIGKSWYKIETDVETYIVIFIVYFADSRDSDNLGMYAIRILKEEDEEKKFPWDEVPGICIVE